MADGRELTLRIQSHPLDGIADRKPRQLLEAPHQLSVIRARASGVAGLEQEWQTDGKSPLFEPLQNGFLTIFGDATDEQTRPG